MNFMPGRTSWKPIKVWFPFDDSDETKSDFGKVVKRKRGQGKEWIMLKKYSKEKEVEEFLKIEDTWSRSYTRMTEQGLKRYYRCNKVKKRERQCAAELFFIFVHESNNILAYRTIVDHDHDNNGSYNYGINKQTKSEIDKYLRLFLKPKSILKALEKMNGENGIRLPTITQLNNYIASKKLR